MLSTSQAAQAHYRNADVTIACERCCVTNGYLQRFKWDINGFSLKREKIIVFLLFYSVLFARVSGRFEAFSAS